MNGNKYELGEMCTISEGNFLKEKDFGETESIKDEHQLTWKEVTEVCKNVSLKGLYVSIYTLLYFHCAPAKKGKRMKRDELDLALAWGKISIR